MQANAYLWTEVRGRLRVADVLVESFHLAGAEHVFAMPAESLNPILDAIRKSGRVRLVTVRHEGLGALMASAYAKLTGRLGVCMGTAGPGASHLPIGTYDARADRAPLLAVSGQVPLHQVGSGGFQEIDLLGLFRDSTGFSRLVVSARQLPLAARACAYALHRRTAVHLAFPSDVLAGPVEPGPDLRLPREWLAPHPVPDAGLLARAAARLGGAGEAAVIVGAVGAEARPATERVAARLGAPVAVLPEGFHYLRDRPQHPTLRVGGRSDDAARALVGRASRVLVVGPMSPSCTLLVAPSAAVVNVAPAEDVGGPLPAGVLRLAGSVSDVLLSLAPRLEASRDGALVREAASLSGPPAEMRPLGAEFWASVDRALPDDALLALEPGPVLESAFFHLPVRGRRVTSSFQHGARGYALPGAIAGALAFKRPAFAVTGAGGFVESMAELLTASKYSLPVNVICVGGLDSDPPAPFDVCGAARALTAEAWEARDEDALVRAARECLARPGPAVVHVAGGERLARPAPITLAGSSGTAGRAAEAAPAGSVGAVLAEVLERAGVTRVYACPRPALDGFRRALEARGRVRFVPVRHPESAAMMASACSKWTGRPAACAAADAADLLFQLNGLYDAAFDRNPVLVLTGPIPRGPRAEGAARLDPERLLEDIAAVSVRLEGGPETAGALAAALAEATRSRTVAHASVDWSRLDAPAGAVPMWIDQMFEPEPLVPSPTLLEEAADRLARARRPVILVGRGGLDALEEVVEIAALLSAPIATTMPARRLSPDHPHMVGGIGASGHRSAIDAVAGCDVLLALGASNRGAVFGLRGRFFQIQVDRDPLQLGRRPCPTLGLYGSTKQTLEALLPRLRERGGDASAARGRRRYLRRHRSRFERWWREAERTHERSRHRPIAPPAVCHALARTLAELGRRAVVTVDVGVNTLWVYRHFLGDHDFVWTSSFATMGFALPAAIAIGEMESARTVIAMSGDGGMGISLGELASAAARGIPLVAVVFNNGKLAAIKYEQEVMGWPEYESTLVNGSFARYAEACGARGLRVTEPGALGAALREALTCGRPCVVDVVCDPHFMPAPPRIHPRQAAGYLLARARELRIRLRASWAARAGRGSERTPQLDGAYSYASASTIGVRRATDDGYQAAAAHSSAAPGTRSATAVQGNE